MATEVKMEGKPNQTTPKMTIENAMINIVYTAQFAISIIQHNLELRLNHKGASLGQRRKMLFNQIFHGFKTSKYAFDELYGDYEKAWGNNFKNHDMERKNSNALARMLLLWFDRIEGYEGREDIVIDFMKKTFPEDVINDDILKEFFMK